MAYDLESLYVGEVVEHNAGADKNDNLKVVLDVKLAGKLMDKFNPDGGVDPLDQNAVVQVQLNFSDSDTRMDILEKQLEKLGFDADTTPITALIPGEPGHHSFVGQKVFLQGTLSSQNGKTSLFWNLRFPRRFQARLDTEKRDLVLSKVTETWSKRKKAKQETTQVASAEIPF